jgi:RIO kinase 1
LVGIPVPEGFKVYAEVFDRATLFTLYKLCNDGYFDVLEGPISTGKEANIHRCLARGRYLVAKIYRIATSDFRNMWKYIKGDPRFDWVKLRKRDIVYAWAKKEYANLAKAREAGVRVPKPIACRNNVLLMEYIGINDDPAPMAKNLPPKRPRIWFKKIIDWVDRLYKHRLIHGDLSEYNLLNQRGKPVLIDISQGVLLEHPLAKELLMRDFENITEWFSKLGVKENPALLYQRITGEEIGVLSGD